MILWANEAIDSNVFYFLTASLPSSRLSDSLTGTPDCGCFFRSFPKKCWQIKIRFIFVPVKGYRQSFCNYFSQAFFVLLVKINRSNIDSFVSFRFWREWESHKVYLYSLSAVSFFYRIVLTIWVNFNLNCGKCFFFWESELLSPVVVWAIFMSLIIRAVFWLYLDDGTDET